MISKKGYNITKFIQLFSKFFAVLRIFIICVRFCVYFRCDCLQYFVEKLIRILRLYSRLIFCRKMYKFERLDVRERNDFLNTALSWDDQLSRPGTKVLAPRVQGGEKTKPVSKHYLYMYIFTYIFFLIYFLSMK